MATNVTYPSTAADPDTRETPSLISSEKVRGTAVRRSGGEKLGSIEHLMIDKRSGHVAYAIMSFGGFLGLGEDHYALPWHALRYNTRLDAYELNIAEERLRDARIVTDESWKDRSWELPLHNSFGYPPYWL